MSVILAGNAVVSEPGDLGVQFDLVKPFSEEIINAHVEDPGRREIEQNDHSAGICRDDAISHVREKRFRASLLLQK